MTKHTEDFILSCGHTKGIPWNQHAKPGTLTKCFACPPRIDLKTNTRTAPNRAIDRKAN